MNTLSRDELYCVSQFLTLPDIIQLAKSKVVSFDKRQAYLRIKDDKWFQKSKIDVESWYKFNNWCPTDFRDKCDELPMILAKTRWCLSEDNTISIGKIIYKNRKKFPTYDLFISYIKDLYGSMYLFEQYSQNIFILEKQRKKRK